MLVHAPNTYGRVKKNVRKADLKLFLGGFFCFSGHSLGAGVAVLVALKLRPRYPHLKVFAFSTPGKYNILTF